MDQHHVQVGVRRQLAAAVAADRDQGAPPTSGPDTDSQALTHSASAAAVRSARSAAVTADA